MSKVASLWARLKRLEVQAGEGPDEIDLLIRRQPMAVLMELSHASSNPSQRVRVLLEELAPRCGNNDELMLRLITRLSADLASESG